MTVPTYGSIAAYGSGPVARVMKAREAVETVRSYVMGSQAEDISVLAQPYSASAQPSQLILDIPKKATPVGCYVTAGLNTFLVRAVGVNGTVLDVVPAPDGGPISDIAAGEFVRIKPAFTNWAIFREIQSEIDGMSSRDTGLYWPWVLESTDLSWSEGVYSIPDRADGTWPFRMVKAEYLASGSNIYQAFTDAEYQPQNNAIRVFSDPPQVAMYRFTMACYYGQMNSLDTDLSTVGLTAALAGIPMLGAAATMVLGWEGRRTEPMTQGDPRRAAEVAVSSNASLARQWRLQQQAAITQEQSRLAGAYGYRQPMSLGLEQRTSRW